MSAPTPLIHPLAPSDADAFRALRLEALANAPAAFSSSFEDQARQPVDWFRARIPAAGPNALFGAFADNALAGMAGFVVQEGAKQRHKGTLWGVYVAPAWRGRGLATQLVECVIAYAKDHVVVLQATIWIDNPSARRIYHRLGFVPYGIERKALYVDGVFHDNELLALEFSKR
jgi:RimJ/RimL family protein N-acetyltransferase